MPGSLHLGKIAGINIEVNASWLIIFVLLTVSLATSWFPATVPHLSVGLYFVLGALASILLFAAVLAHELAHSLVARARGLPVKSITLFVFGGVSDLEREPQSAGVEFQMALVGPVTSLVIGAIAWPIGNALRATIPVLAALLEYVGLANLLLGAFNLIPGFPLDGGRVLRSIIWQATGNLRTATRWAARVGQVIAYLFILGGIWLLFGGDVVDGLWLGFIGWFLSSAAQAETTQVETAAVFGGITVGAVMSPVSLSVSPSMTLQQVVEDYLLPHGLRAVPVTELDRLVGLVTLRDIRHVSRDRWAEVTVSAVMIPLDRLHVVRPAQPLAEALPLMVDHDVNQLPVVEDGRLVGMLSRDAMLRLVQVRRDLGLVERARSRPPGQPQAS